IGGEHYDAAPRAKIARRRDRAGERTMAVMHHAPDIDEPGAVARTDLLDRGDHRDGWSDRRHAARLEARSLRVKLAGLIHLSRYFGFCMRTTVWGRPCSRSWPNISLTLGCTQPNGKSGHGRL